MSLHNFSCMGLKKKKKKVYNSWSLNSPNLYEPGGFCCVGPGSGDLTARPHDRDTLRWWMMVEHNHLGREKTHKRECFSSNVFHRGWIFSQSKQTLLCLIEMKQWNKTRVLFSVHETLSASCHLSLWKIKVIGKGIGLTAKWHMGCLEKKESFNNMSMHVCICENDK